MRPRAALLAFALAGALAPGHASAYVQSRTAGGKVKLWVQQSCIPVTVYVNGFDKTSSANMSYDAIVKSVTAAAHAWSPDVVDCASGSTSPQPYLEIVPTIADDTTKPPAVADDHRNTVVFRTDMWRRSGDPKNPDYADSALAITTVTSNQDGTIDDADIEVHATPAPAWRWANLDPGVVPPSDPQLDIDVYDLQTALTHEFGHFLGLEHSCFNALQDGGPVDVNGVLRPLDDHHQPAPDCDSATGAVMQTVMFWKVDPLDTNKRVLSSDEKRFLCEIYPAANDPNICKADEAPGCSTAPRFVRRGGPSGRAIALVALAGLGLVVAGRRARSRRVSARAKARS